METPSSVVESKHLSAIVDESKLQSVSLSLSIVDELKLSPSIFAFIDDQKLSPWFLHIFSLCEMVRIWKGSWRGLTVLAVKEGERQVIWWCGLYCSITS